MDWLECIKFSMMLIGHVTIVLFILCHGWGDGLATAGFSCNGVYTGAGFPRRNATTPAQIITNISPMIIRIELKTEGEVIDLDGLFVI